MSAEIHRRKLRQLISAVYQRIILRQQLLLSSGASASAVSDHDTGISVDAAEEMSVSRCHYVAFTEDKQYVSPPPSQIPYCPRVPAPVNIDRVEFNASITRHCVCTSALVKTVFSMYGRAGKL